MIGSKPFHGGSKKRRYLLQPYLVRRASSAFPRRPLLWADAEFFGASLAAAAAGIFFEAPVANVSGECVTKWLRRC
ncbi:MAG: hypothetical protein LIP18_00325, partial [Planctomycetes bacterium]|nr:hypothetical protein [Planctomycetota bacterium]